MSHAIQDLTGQTIGKLTLLERTNTKQNGAYIYRCLCECGKEVFKSRTTLIGAQRGEWMAHCGCLGWGRLRGAKDKIVNVRPPSLKDEEHSREKSKRHLYLSYQQGASTHGIEWELQEGEFFELTRSDCFYCAGTPSQQHSLQENVPYLYNGIDRVNNFQGYTRANCVPCCGTCNRMKHTLTYDDFVTWVVKIAETLSCNIEKISH